MVAEQAASRRLFTALWPDEQQRQQLRQQIKGLPHHGRAVKADNWHITLKYLGPCDAEQQACLQQQLEGLAIPAIRLQLDHSGCFPRPQVAWLGCPVVPPELEELVARLERALHEGCGFDTEPRRYRPHITIYRKVRDYPRLTLEAPLTLTFTSIVLVESLSTPEGVHYQVLKTYPANA